jgi:uncharacterized repeat protein (TIGR01451 family)
MRRYIHRHFVIIVVGALVCLSASINGFRVLGDQQAQHGDKTLRQASPRNSALQRVVSSLGSHSAIATFGNVLPPPPQADLDQTRNGAANGPISPANWVNGNAGGSTSHFIEGYSIPYRIVLENMAVGAHTVEIEWDIRHSGANAIDYITHYNRLNSPSHTQMFGHAPETIDPTIGVTGLSGFTTFAIPEPNTASPTIATTSFNALPAAERVMTIYNGTITALTYLSEGDLTASNSSTRMLVNFTVTNPTAVITWGGHIAWYGDWGLGNSAGSKTGSPYHTRLISLDGSGGNQDRSLSADSILPNSDLSVNKAVSNATPTIGADVTFTVNVANSGLSNATGVTVSDVLPSGYVSGATTSWTEIDHDIVD